MSSGGTSRSSVMIADSQLAQLNSPVMQPCSATTVEDACARCQDQTGALHTFFDTNESESCVVKAPAKHASESVLVVGELLCTGVHANTERHEGNARNVLMLKIQTTKPTPHSCDFNLFPFQVDFGFVISRPPVWRLSEPFNSHPLQPGVP